MGLATNIFMLAVVITHFYFPDRDKEVPRHGLG